MIPSLETVCTLATTTGPDYFRFFGRLHPLVVHFPIALILVAVVFELPTMLRRNKQGPGHSAFAHRCVILGSIAAVFAAWFGWLNADLESHGPKLASLITWHRWLGVTTAGLAVAIVLLPLFNRTGTRGWASRTYRLGLVIAAVTLAIGGHLGGEIVYGEGYVLDALRARPVDDGTALASTTSGDDDAAAPAGEDDEDDDDAGAPDGRVTFVKDIQPIFAGACFHCHGPDKAKSGLRLHRKSEVFGPEPDWWVVRPNDADGSILLELISKPDDDPDLMPADDGPLSPDQIALVRRWIETGAEWGDESAGETVAQAPAGPTEPASGTERAATEVSPELPAPASVDAGAVAAAVSAVEAAGGVATPIAQDTPAIDVTYSVGGAAIGDSALDALRGLEPVLAWLDLGRTSVTDAGVKRLASFGELRKLHLERTQVTDAALPDLAGLRNLRYLNLYGTAITDAAVETLAALPRLEQVYLWDTQVTGDGIQRLATLRPELSVVAALDLPPIVDSAAQIRGTPAPCCAEAAAAGRECDHECCVAARAEGRVCEKCGGKPAE